MASIPDKPLASATAVSTRARGNRRSALPIWWQEIDRPVFILVLILMAIGTVAVAAASPASARRLSTSAAHLSDLYFLKPHMMWQALGLAAMLWASSLSKEGARRFGILIGGAMLASLLLVFVPVIGVMVKGSHRWINLGFTTLQPSEFLKCGWPILLAWILSWRVRDGSLPVIAICTGAMTLVGVLLMAQPDFGSTMLFGGTFFVMIMLAGMPMKRIAMFCGAGLAGIVLMYFTYDNGRNRIDAFLSGGQEFDQVDLAQKTLLNGGWSGAGFWMGTRKLSLPEAHTDYIFSVIGEEFGLLACAAIIVLYFTIVARIIVRLTREDDLFTVLAGTGFATQFGGQAFINILVNLQLFPSKGMTLPLISYGGSSTVAVCLSMGLLLAITRRNPFIKRESFSLADIGEIA